VRLTLFLAALDLDIPLTVAAWKHKFTAECLSIVHDQAFGTRCPSYATIQDLDKKVRNWYVPPSLVVPGFGSSKIGAEVDQPSTELTMQRYIAFAIKEISEFLPLPLLTFSSFYWPAAN